MSEPLKRHRRDPATLPDGLRNLSAWPGVDASALDDTARALYRSREQAVRRYVQGEPVSQIENATGVVRTQIYRMLRRCLERHPDGRLYGWRALLPQLRTKRYTRLDKVGPGAPGRFGGAAGAMTQLLERNADLEAFLRREIAQHRIALSASGRLLGLRPVHRQFIAHCRALGLTNRSYPLNQENQGLVALSQAIRRLLTERFVDSAKASGTTRVQPNRSETDWPAPAPITRAFEAVEFDGHKLDVRLRVRSQDPQGIQRDWEVGRAWLLVVLDVATRAVLGWRMAVVPEYNRYDVIQTFIQALRPKRKRKQFLIPGMRYERGAGFVDEVAPGATYALWDWLRFDNARANLADETLVTLTETLGCLTDAGPIADPNERAYVERFFGTIGSHLSHRLPGTTGKSADDVRRILSAVNGKTELLLTADELEELVDVTIANYNGTAHAGIGMLTPLEAVSQSLARERAVLRTLPEVYQRNPHLLQPAHPCTIRGDVRRGVRPYISLYGARYSSAVLGEGVRLIGTHIRIHFDPDDMRVVYAYFPNGEELGPLSVARPWNTSAHSLRLRQEILRMRRQRQLQYGDLDDPVLIWTKAQRKQLGKRGKAKHALVEAERSLRQAPATRDEATTTTDTSLKRPARPKSLAQKSLAHLGKGPILR